MLCNFLDSFKDSFIYLSDVSLEVENLKSSLG
jgi:hypothetical protein